jgi:peptidoglycan/xylan/chitin deacetylase (PgdA/CDA1 family)
MRGGVKRALAWSAAIDRGAPRGATVLTLHRVGGGTDDELDLPTERLVTLLDLLADSGLEVVSLDEALDRLDASDPAPSAVLSFDDGFRDLFTNAWPLLQDRSLPFTLYLTAGLVGGQMRWEGSGAASQGAPALEWAELREMWDSGLLTVGNHTWDHPRPVALDAEQLDRCSDEVERRLGRRPAHFAWPWGIEVPGLQAAVQQRFRSAATGEIGRNDLDQHRWALRRVPVRRSDPAPFVAAKLRGGLWPERAYAQLVRTAKAVRA